jgi:hypothetical protein
MRRLAFVLVALSILLLAECGRTALDPSTGETRGSGGGVVSGGTTGQAGIAGSGGMGVGGSQASTADAGPGCTPPVVGAACTTDESPCATCCTQVWTCQDGAWQSRFLGCLPTFFDCGDKRCNEVGWYCEISTGAGGQNAYVCKELPSACKTARCPPCDCLTQAGISYSQCTTNAGGAIWAVK